MGISEIQSLKNQFRLSIKKQISALSNLEKEQKSQKIMQSLQSLLCSHQGLWGAFDSLPSEPKIEWSVINPNIVWCFVQVDQDNIVFINRKNNQVYQAQDLKGICIPALGFNTNGARLGRGGGYYDRELKNYKNEKIGIAYDLAVNEQIPFEAHDTKVDAIVTDREIIQTAA